MRNYHRTKQLKFLSVIILVLVIFSINTHFAKAIEPVKCYYLSCADSWSYEKDLGPYGGWVIRCVTKYTWDPQGEKENEDGCTEVGQICAECKNLCNVDEARVHCSNDCKSVITNRCQEGFGWLCNPWLVTAGWHQTEKKCPQDQICRLGECVAVSSPPPSPTPTCLLSCDRCSNNKDCTKVSWCERKSGNSTENNYGTCANPINYNQDRKETGTNGDTCCPSDEWTSDCQCNNQYYEKKAKHYYCDNGSLKTSYEWLPYMKCDQPSYGSWSKNYCKNGDVYHKRQFTDQGCDADSSTYCYCYTKAPVSQEKLVEDCPEDCPCEDGVCTCADNPPCTIEAAATPNPIPCGENHVDIYSTKKVGVDSCEGLGTFRQDDSPHYYNVYCKGDSEHSDCSLDHFLKVTKAPCRYKCLSNGDCVVWDTGKYTTSNCDNKCSVPSCSVTATANPNPIPKGQNQVTIDKTGSGYSSCTGTGTFTQNSSSHTYTVNCVGNSTHSDCSDSIIVTREGETVPSCSVTATADPNPVPVDEDHFILDYDHSKAVGVSSCKYGVYTLPKSIFKSSDSRTIYTINCTGDSSHNDCSDSIIVTKEPGETDSCSVTVSADPSNISLGDSTIISVDTSDVDSCEIYPEDDPSNKDNISEGSPITVTPSSLPKTYKVACTGDTGYNDCDDNVIITVSGGPDGSLTVTLTGEPTEVNVDEDVAFVATPSIGSADDYNWDWYIEDPDAGRRGLCEMHNPIMDGHFRHCGPMGRASLWNNVFASNIFSYFSHLIVPSTQGAVTSRSIVYQWSTVGNYDVKVIIEKKGASAITATSNIVTINVGDGEPSPDFDFCITSLEVTPMSRFLTQPITISWDIDETNCDTNTCILSCNDANIESENYGQEAYPHCGLDEAMVLTSSYGSIDIYPKYSGKYTYSIHCDSRSDDLSYDGDFTTDPVKIAPLPWWREIIPTLTGFLKGSLIR